MVEFEEEGEMIHMEIDDGGAAQAEFASDEEMENEQISSDSEQEENFQKSFEDYGSQDEMSNPESGEIDIDSEYETEKNTNKDVDKKKVGKKKDRKSAEDRLDNMSNTLKAVQDLLLKNGMLKDDKGKKDSKSRDKKSDKKGKNPETTNTLGTYFRNNSLSKCTK